MKRELSCLAGMLLTTAVLAAEPPDVPAEPAAARATATTTATATATGTAAPARAAATPATRPPAASTNQPRNPETSNAPAPRPPLDLRIGDVRRYATPDELRAALGLPDEEQNTVVVQAIVPLLPMETPLDVPGGILAPFWAIAHPSQGWRIFLPDPRAKEIPPPDSKIPPPVFRWGP